MLVQLSINDKEYSAFMNIVEHLRSDMVNSVTVLEPADAGFIVSSRETVRERVESAERRGEYTEHDSFWQDV